MNDLEVAFCTYRGQLDVLIELLERVVRHDIPAERRRAIARVLLAIVDDELRVAPPPYAALLRELLANRPQLDVVIADEQPPWDEYGYYTYPVDVLGGLRARFETYARLVELLGATGPMLSDAWIACDDALVLPLLELAPDADAMRERVRDALIAQLHVTPFGDAYVEGIAIAARRDATLGELVGAARALAFDAFRARLGNPFAPALPPTCEVTRARLASAFPWPPCRSS